MQITMGMKLAEGGYAYVYLAHDRSNSGTVYALKRIVCHDTEQLHNALAEGELLARLPPHPNIITFIGAPAPPRRCALTRRRTH